MRPEDVEPATGSPYPADIAGTTAGRRKRRLGNAFGLGQFGVNLLELPPGCDSSLRHWHSHEDEFVWLLEGEVVLVDEGGERPMRTGECIGFPAGSANAHCFRNKGERDARLLEIGSRRKGVDVVRYPDADMEYSRSEGVFRRPGRDDVRDGDDDGK